MTTTKTKPKKRPTQDTEGWPGSFWTALALDRVRRDSEGNR